MTSRRSAGRPREFDREGALKAAMLVFWSKGFEGASTADLTAAIGISKPSMYAAFGDKERLWKEALRAYLGLRAQDYEAALNLPTVRQVAEAWLRLTGGVRQEMNVPNGCLIVQGALVGSDESKKVQAELTQIRAAGTKQLERRFKKGQDEGDMPGSWQPASLAQFVSALASGLAVQSVDGVSIRVLNHIVDQLMENWPIRC